MIPILKKNEALPDELSSNAFVVLINKPKGWTSFDVVNKIRHALKIKKVGHAGTLDPFATGLLIIGVGRATKQLQQFMNLDKRYRAVIQLGVETDTYDVTGEIVRKEQTDSLDKEQVILAVEEMRGEILQMPPMFSAKKINGTPLYKLARKGKQVERKAVPVTIHKAEVLSWNSPFLKLDLLVSKGTYIRSYAHDLGQRLGVGAHLFELERLQIGSYSVDHSFDINEFVDYWKTKVKRLQ